MADHRTLNTLGLARAGKDGGAMNTSWVNIRPRCRRRAAGVPGPLKPGRSRDPLSDGSTRGWKQDHGSRQSGDKACESLHGVDANVGPCGDKDFVSEKERNEHREDTNGAPNAPTNIGGPTEVHLFY